MRLIDIEPFETEANLIWCQVSRTHGGDGFINVANTNTKEIPTVDAVEVVRCKARSETSMTEWAKREIELACKRERGDKHGTEWDYGCACYESAYKAFQSLMDDGHSGMSIGFTKNILNRLIDGKPLTAIEDTPDVWNEVTYRRESRSYQCRRMSSLFKDVFPDGRVEYHDNDRSYCVNKDDPNSPAWHNGFISRLIHEKYPITMPYFPASKPMVVYCTEGLSNPKNGDFDTIGVWYVLKPDGEKDIIERFFKESADSWEEISKQEYFERVEEASDG